MADSDFKKLMNMIDGMSKKGKKPTTVDLTAMPEGLAEFIAHLHTHLDEIHTMVEDLATSNKLILDELTRLKESGTNLHKLFMQYADEVIASRKDLTQAITQTHGKETKGRKPKPADSVPDNGV